MWNSDVEVNDGIAAVERCQSELGVVVRPVYRSERIVGVARIAVKERPAGSKRFPVGTAHDAGYGTEPIIVLRAVITVDVVERLVQTRDADVVRKHTIRRRAAGFDRGAMIERRRCDAERAGRVPGKRSAFDDLVNEAGETLALGRRRVRAGVDLDFGIPERRRRARSVVVERAVYRDAVELVPDLVVIATANVDRRVVARLVRDDVRTGYSRNRRVSLVDQAAAAHRCGRLLRRRIDRIDVSC